MERRASPVSALRQATRAPPGWPSLRRHFEFAVTVSMSRRGLNHSRNRQKWLSKAERSLATLELGQYGYFGLCSEMLSSSAANRPSSERLGAN
jgi:hypothetical protein